MTTDLKTSLLVNKQVPEFILDEYPKFVAFLEAYYQFMEEKQGTEKNDLVTVAKSLRTIKDVDDSLESFETNFYNTYAALIPSDVQANKELLFKHLTELYRTKGADSSFKLLFQLVFGEDIEVILPKNNVLKPSSSKWTVDNKLRINTDISSVYVGDGVKKIFPLAQITGSDEVSISVNGISKENNVDYYINKEYRQLIFITAPSAGAVVSALYDNFDFKLLVNRKVTGLTSSASAIIEDANRRIISDTFNLGLPIELLINVKSLRGTFLNGEKVSIPIFDDNEELIDIQASTFSVIKRFTVVNSGNGYVVGDKVTVFGGNSTINATGTVSEVFKGTLSSIASIFGGAVFTNTSPIIPSGNGLFGITAFVDGIDYSGANSANLFLVSSDIIASFNGNANAANTRIDAADYGFLNANLSGGENLNCRIVDSLSYQQLSVGPITNVKILFTTAPLTTPITFDAFGALYGPESSYRTVKSLGTIGSFKINDGGSGYKIGDEVTFGPNPVMTFGQGAAAVVGNISATGAITRIDLANSRISGTVTLSGSPPSPYITGTGTFFTKELKVDDIIDVNGESRMVATITDDVTLMVKGVDSTPGAPTNGDFNKPHLNQKVGVFKYYPKGGHSYVQNNFPTVTVSSSTGIGANIQIASIASDGEQLSASGTGNVGSIITIDVVDPGSGYQFIPVAAVESGSGTGAKVKAEIEQSYVATEGRWTTSDSIISSSERNIQGRNYYVDYSYLISSRTEFYKYKKLLKELLHPVGFVNYSEYKTTQVIERDDIFITKKNITTDTQYKTLGGRVNVGNGSVVVTGINTKFNTAISLGILSIGSNISVNGETRTVNSIISNTTLITSGNVLSINIANAGAGYSNGNLVFSNGGGTVTSLVIDYKGSGYSNGALVFKSASEGIMAIANVEVYPSNGSLRTVTLSSGGLYFNKPFVEPFTNPHLVFYANTVTVENPGKGYTNGKFIILGGGATRDAQISYNVYASNGAINSASINVGDSGLYESNSVLLPNTTPNAIIHTISTVNAGLGHSNGFVVFNDTGVASITANAGAIAVNSWISFSNNIGTVGASNVVAANARVFVNTTGHIMNVTVYSNGIYFNAPTISNVYTNLTYFENTTPISTSSYSNVVFNISTLRYSVQPARIAVETFPANGSIRKLTIQDPGLYSNSVRVTSITANANSVGVNGWITLDGILGYTATGNSTNARVFVNTEGYIENVTVYANGFYSSIPEVSNSYTNVTYYENTSPISTGSYTNAVFTITTTNAPTTNGLLVGILNTYPISVISIAANNITYNGIAHKNGYVTFSGGDPIINANATIEVHPANGVIRSITVANAGLYRSAPTVRANSIPVSITEVLPYTPDFGGRGYANGYLKIVNGGSNVNTFGASQSSANVQVIANTTGSIVAVRINSTGIYANGENIVLYPAVESITANANSIGVNSWITFSYGTPDSAVNIANARVYVNTQGYIQNVTVIANGIYTVLPTTIGGSSEANVYTDLKYVNDARTVAEGGSSAANGSNGYLISTASYTNAVFTIVMGPVLYHFNGATQGKVTGDNKLAVGARFGLAYNANTTNLANLVVSTTANGLYTANVTFTANSNIRTNAVFTVSGVANSQTIAVINVGFTETNIAASGLVEVWNNSSGTLPGNVVNGAVRTVTITGNGSYYYSPTITPNTVGTMDAVLLTTTGAFTQTANLQTAIIT